MAGGPAACARPPAHGVLAHPFSANEPGELAQVYLGSAGPLGQRPRAERPNPRACPFEVIAGANTILFVPTTIHIPDVLLERVDTRAKTLGISRNRLILEACGEVVPGRRVRVEGADGHAGSPLSRARLRVNGTQALGSLAPT
jgi:hypothetical protein